MKDGWDKFAIIMGALTGLAWVVCIVVLAMVLGCTPVARAARPISASHSQLTATDYDAAEAAFGGPDPAPLEVWTDARCQALLDRRDGAGAVVLGLVGMTGAGGVATLVPKDAAGAERQRWDLGLGLTTLVAATAATVLGALGRSWSATYEQRCATELEGAP